MLLGEGCAFLLVLPARASLASSFLVAPVEGSLVLGATEAGSAAWAAAADSPTGYDSSSTSKPFSSSCKRKAVYRLNGKQPNQQLLPGKHAEGSRAAASDRFESLAQLGLRLTTVLPSNLLGQSAAAKNGQWLLPCSSCPWPDEPGRHVVGRCQAAGDPMLTPIFKHLLMLSLLHFNRESAPQQACSAAAHQDKLLKVGAHNIGEANKGLPKLGPLLDAPDSVQKLLWLALDRVMQRLQPRLCLLLHRA